MYKCHSKAVQKCCPLSQTTSDVITCSYTGLKKMILLKKAAHSVQLTNLGRYVK